MGFSQEHGKRKVLSSELNWAQQVGEKNYDRREGARCCGGRTLDTIERPALPRVS